MTNITKKQEHTPGPWIIQPSSENSDSVVVVDSATESFVLAGLFPRDERHMADARLIAAAPDLLATLTNLYDLIDNHSGHPPLERLMKSLDRAQSAIEKATGRAR